MKRPFEEKLDQSIETDSQLHDQKDDKEAISVINSNRLFKRRKDWIVSGFEEGILKSFDPANRFWCCK